MALWLLLASLATLYKFGGELGVTTEELETYAEGDIDFDVGTLAGVGVSITGITRCNHQE